jgi:hypothetical protein
MTETGKARDILARTLWGEARGESLAGQIAVAWARRTATASSWRIRLDTTDSAGGCSVPATAGDQGLIALAACQAYVRELHK